MEDADRVRAAADARDDRLGKPTFDGEELLARLAADDGLQLGDDLRIRRRADARADEVVRRLDVRDPVADRLARRFLQRLRAEVDRAHLGAHEVHALDVGLLAAHVLLAHVHDALEAEARAHGRGRDAVLARAGLGDDAVLAEPPREHRLAERVVELVRAGVEEILPLEVDPLAGREALRERERRRAAGVRREERVELGAEALVLLRGAPAGVELVERRDQRLRDVAPAVLAEVAHDACSLYERAHFRVILDSGRGLEPRRTRRPPTAGRSRSRHARCPARARRRASTRAHRVPSARSSSGRDRARPTGGRARSRDVPGCRATEISAAASDLALVGLVDLHEIGAAIIRLADGDRDRQRRVGDVEDGGALGAAIPRRR